MEENKDIILWRFALQPLSSVHCGRHCENEPQTAECNPVQMCHTGQQYEMETYNKYSFILG